MSNIAIETIKAQLEALQSQHDSHVSAAATNRELAAKQDSQASGVKSQIDELTKAIEILSKEA